MGGRKRSGAARARRLLDVDYAGKLEAIVFTLPGGSVAGVPIERLDELDPSPISRVMLIDDGHGLLVEQFSGHTVELCARALLDRAGEAIPERAARGRDVAPVRSARYRSPV